ncbi:MAG: oligosaccharide flippase family protein [Lentisphaerae bacterium]|nr:oligosaccharide flippase family protein [Lentisphaerota bacterium]
MKRRFALTSLLNIFGVGLGFAISLVITPFMLRTLGKEAYGVWVLVTAFSVVSGYMSLLDLGLQSAVVKFVSEHHARREVDAINQVFSVGLYLFGGLGVLGAFALVLFAKLFLTRVFNIPSDLVEMTRLLLYLLATQILFEFPGLIFSAVVDGLQRYDLQRAIQIGYTILYAVLLVTLLLLGYGLMALGITMLVLAVAKALVLVILAWRLLPSLRLERDFDRGLLRRVANFSGQIFLIRINAIVYNTMDKTIIGALLTTTQLTGYDIANKLRNISMVPMSFITPQIVPAAATLHGAGDQVRLQELFLKGTKYQMAIMTPVIVTVLVLAERFIRVWLGPDYAYLASLAQLFVVSVFLDAMIGVGQNVLLGVGRVKPMLWISVVGTAVNLSLSVFLTLRIGIAGVMWGTLIDRVISVVPYYWFLGDSLKISWTRFWREVFWPTYSVGIVAAVLLYSAEKRLVLPDNLWTLGMLGLAGVGSYFLLFWVFSLGGDERKMLLQTGLQAVGLRP